MDKTLRFWVEADAGLVTLIDDPDADPLRVQRAILQHYEDCGYARRRLDKKGQTIWRATRELERYLKEAELDREDDEFDDNNNDDE
jgi:hypothetical protein